MPKRKRSKKNKTGFFGVIKTSSERYRTQIWIDGTMKNLGTYDTAKQAAKAYDTEAIILRKPFSSLNYPKQVPVGYTPKQQPLVSRNTVGYRGVSKKSVSKSKRRKTFQTQIIIGGKNTHIGTYETAKEAAIAYDRFVLKANQCTSLLNFPDMVHNLDVEPKRKKYTGSSSGYRGVVKVPSGRFVADISIDKKQRRIGTFDTAMQAALAYDQAAINAGKQNVVLNFPEGLPIKVKRLVTVSQKVAFGYRV